LISRLCAAVALILSLAGCDYLYHQRTVYAIEGATLIDGGPLPPVSPAVVVVVDGKITAMGLASEVTIPRNAQHIDATGRFICPISLSQPLTVGGPGDLIVCDVNPTRDPEYKKKSIYGRINNGLWSYEADSPSRKNMQMKPRIVPK